METRQQLGKVISLDKYRRRNQPRYNEDEVELLNRFRSNYSDGKEAARQHIMNDPELLVRLLEDKLTQNGHSQRTVDRVGHFLEELQGAYPDAPNSEVSRKVWDMFSIYTKVTRQEMEARAAQTQAANTKKAAAVLSLMDYRKKRDQQA